MGKTRTCFIFYFLFSGPDVTLTPLPRLLPFFISAMAETQINVECLGSTILSKATTSGLGSIQKPLYEKYIQYRKSSGKGKKSQRAWLKVNPDGITVIFPTDEPGHTQNYFYEKNSINFFDAVRFTVTKGNDKKFHYAFLPIDESHSLNQGYDKLFSQMDKKYQNYAKMEHPTIITCVMRRQSGVRALDCHGFVTENDSDAFRIMSAFSAMPPEMRRLGPDVQDEHEPRYQYRPPQGQKPDLIQTEFGQFGIYKGGKPINLTDEHFRGNTREPDRRGYQDEPEVDRYIGNIGKDERPQNRYSFENRNARRDDYQEGQPVYAKVNRNSGEIHHDRQRSGELVDNGRPSNLHFRQRSNEIEDVHSPRYEDRSPYGQDRGRMQNREDHRIPRVMSPLRNQGREPPATAPKPQRALSPEPRFPRQDGRTPESPRGVTRNFSGRERPPSGQIDAPESPRGGQRHSFGRDRPPSGPISSVSNLESRQDKPQKPVAKVPPHLVAGIKVLPTGFVPKAESPKSPRRDLIGNIENYYTNDDDDPYDNAVSRQDFYDNRKMVKSDSMDEKYYREQDKSFGSNPPPDVLPKEEAQRNFREKGYEQRSKSNTESPRFPNDERTKRSSAPQMNYGKHWTYGEQLEKFKQTEYEEPSNSSNFEHEPRDSGGKMVVDKNGAKIEHDYANMFSKVGIREDANSQLHTAGTNFESELGYFP